MPAVRALGVGAPLTVGGGGTPRVTVAPLVIEPLTGVPRTKAPRGGPTPRPLQKQNVYKSQLLIIKPYSCSELFINSGARNILYLSTTCSLI